MHDIIAVKITNAMHRNLTYANFPDGAAVHVISTCTTWADGERLVGRARLGFGVCNTGYFFLSVRKFFGPGRAVINAVGRAKSRQATAFPKAPTYKLVINHRVRGQGIREGSKRHQFV